MNDLTDMIFLLRNSCLIRSLWEVGGKIKASLTSTLRNLVLSELGVEIILINKDCSALQYVLGDMDVNMSRHKADSYSEKE